VESSQTFPENAIRAIADDQLRDALFEPLEIKIKMRDHVVFDIARRIA
jgi:hypothetical protein